MHEEQRRSTRLPYLSAAEQAPARSASAPVFYGNAGGKGYYRSRYDSADYQQLLRGVETNLTPSERITFLGSQWAQARAGIATVGDFLNLAAAVRDDTSSFVIDTVSAALRSIDQQIGLYARGARRRSQRGCGRTSRLRSRAWVRRLPGTRQIKFCCGPTLFGLLGDIGDDPQIIAEARQISEQYLHDPGFR